MKTKNLQPILDRINWARKYRNQSLLTIETLNQIEVDDIVRDIDCSLEPENLHCDGEISASQAQAKYRQLTGALEELRKLGWQINRQTYSW